MANFRTKKNKTRKFSFSLIVKPLVFVVCFMLLLSGVFVTIESSTYGSEVAKLYDEESAVTYKNRQLKEDLEKASALSFLSTRAKDYGFIKPESVVYVSENSGVAARLP
jgi:hypothetical protein